MKMNIRLVLNVLFTVILIIGTSSLSFSQVSDPSQINQQPSDPEPQVKMETGNNVVEQVNVIDEMIGSIDWENNIVYAVGDGVRPPNAVSEAQARVRAKRAAIDEGYARLLEMVNQVRVDAESLTRNFVNENRVVRTKVSGFIKNAEIVKMRHFEDGSFQIKMKMSMLGANGLSSAILPVHLENVRKVGIAYEISRENAPSSTPSTSSQPMKKDVPTGVVYSGLIIDARGLNVKPALYPKVLTEKNKVIYDISIAEPNATIEEGLCSYRKSLDAAKSLKRVGPNPLIVKAIGISGKHGADLVISEEDTGKILMAAEKEKILSEAKVAIVVD